MKILIQYKKAFDGGYFPCVAEGQYDGITFKGFGNSYEDAKRELLKRIKEYMNVAVHMVPAEEEVEL